MKKTKIHRPLLGYLYLLLIGIIIGYLLPKDEKTQQAIDRLLRRPSYQQSPQKALQASEDSVQEDFTGRVIRVSDGDTITVLVEKEGKKIQEKIRFYGIDAPESKQDFGQKSKTTLSGFIFDKQVHVKVHNRDQYQRLVAEIYCDEKLINLEMVRTGMAWHYEQYSPEAREYAKAMKEAREKKIGIWSQPNPQPPWEFRRARKIRSLVGGKGK